MIVVRAPEEATEEGFDRDDVEVLAGDLVAPYGAGVPAGFEAEVVDVEGADSGEDGVAVSEVADFREREDGEGEIAAAEGPEVVGVGQIEGLENHGVKNAEDDDVRGDAEGEGENGGAGEARGSAELAESEAQVVQQGDQRMPPENCLARS